MAVSLQTHYHDLWWRLVERRISRRVQTMVANPVAEILLNSMALVTKDAWVVVDGSGDFADLIVSLDSGATSFVETYELQTKGADGAWTTVGTWVGDRDAFEMLHARPVTRLRIYFRDHSSRTSTGLFDLGILPFDDLSALESHLSDGLNSMTVRAVVTGRRFAQPSATVSARVPLPTPPWAMPAQLFAVSGTVSIAEEEPLFAVDATTPFPTEAWNSTLGHADLSGAALHAVRGPIQVENRVQLTLAGCTNGKDNLHRARVAGTAKPIFVRFTRVSDGARTSWLDANRATLLCTGTAHGEGCVEEPVTSTVARRVLYVPVTFCNTELVVDVVVAEGSWTLRDVWVETFVRRPEPRFSTTEMIQALWKRDQGVGDTATNVFVTQEVMKSGGPRLRASRTFLEPIPDEPDDLVTLHSNVVLSEVMGSRRSTWSHATLIDGIYPSRGGVYRDAFSVQVLSGDGETWVDVVRENIGAPFLDPTQGAIRFFDADALVVVDANFHDPSHTPGVRASFYRYIGPKLSSLFPVGTALEIAVHAVPWAIDASVVTSEGEGGHGVRWSGLDLAYEANTTVTPLGDRAPYVLSQHVTLVIDDDEANPVEATYVIPRSEVGALASPMSTLLVRRDLTGSPTQDDDDGSRTLTIPLGMPSASKVELRGVTNRNPKGDTDWNSASPVVYNFS